jgi:hypothetical protein
VLGAAAPFPLKQLGLAAGVLIDGEEGLMAALARLPGLGTSALSTALTVTGMSCTSHWVRCCLACSS